MGPKEDLGFQDTKENLDCLEFQGKRVWLVCQVEKETEGNQDPQDHLL